MNLRADILEFKAGCEASFIGAALEKLQNLLVSQVPHLVGGWGSGKDHRHTSGCLLPVPLLSSLSFQHQAVEKRNYSGMELSAVES